MCRPDVADGGGQRPPERPNRHNNGACIELGADWPTSPAVGLAQHMTARLKRWGNRPLQFTACDSFYAGCAALLGNEMPYGEMDGD